MKNIIYALSGACIISVLGIIDHASALLTIKASFDKVLQLEIKLHSEDQVRVTNILTENYHKNLTWQLVECGMYVAITLLLIFAIRGLKVSPTISPV